MRYLNLERQGRQATRARLAATPHASLHRSSSRGRRPAAHSPYRRQNLAQRIATPSDAELLLHQCAGHALVGLAVHPAYAVRTASTPWLSWLRNCTATAVRSLLLKQMSLSLIAPHDGAGAKQSAPMLVFLGGIVTHEFCWLQNSHY